MGNRVLDLKSKSENEEKSKFVTNKYAFVNGITAYSGLSYHQLVLLLDNKSNKKELFAFGNNDVGQCHYSKEASLYFPTKIEEIDGDEILFIHCAYRTSYVSTGKEVYYWGYFPSRSEKTQKIHKIPQLTNISIIEITCGTNHAIFKSDDKRFFGIGSNESGQLGEKIKNTDNAEEILELKGKEVKSMVSGYSHNVFLLTNDAIITNGSNSSKQLGRAGDSGKFLEIDFQPGSPVVQISAANDRSIILLGDCRVFAAGSNGSHKSLINLWIINFTHVPELDNCRAIAIAAGYTHNVLINAEGKLFVWGQNYYGALGQGTSSGYFYGNPILPEKSFKTIVATRISTIIQETNGDVYAIGTNEFGQLGVGKSEYSVNNWIKTTWYQDNKKEIVAFSGSPNIKFSKWTKETHKYFPRWHKDIIVLLLLIHKRYPSLIKEPNPSYKVPKVILLEIIKRMCLF